ncbi:nuclear transport factor 2 family protein [Cryptosporangium arvum]|uniref:Ketosteroid isomerase-like protein n=1 Tax=Cryptosporangium arvum DSM 44712 TaxID=927661 RepID=A0A010ZKZ2_9ACTN|nr:DUF4440 domain-containing protein [Cryptosporangium arvum]EXG79294.1 ketosteroid isomerase-like protein [Cryptosporangium arvum DSM 44712]
MTPVEVVRASMAAYRAQDLDAASALLASDYVFFSPQDAGIDKATFLERCFPTADRFAEQEVVHVVDLGGGEVFLLYEYVVESGRYRNAEVSRVRDGQLVETQVYFGGRLGS